MNAMLIKLRSVLHATALLSLAGFFAVEVSGCSTGTVNTIDSKPYSKTGHLVGEKPTDEKGWNWKFFRKRDRLMHEYTIETLNGEREVIVLERTGSVSVGDCVSVRYENNVAVRLYHDDGCVFQEVHLKRVKVSPVIWNYDVGAETMPGVNTGSHGVLNGMRRGVGEGASILGAAGGDGDGVVILLLPITMTVGAVVGGMAGYTPMISEEKLDGIRQLVRKEVSRTVTGRTLQQSVLSRLKVLGIDGVPGQTRELKSAFKRSSYEIEMVKENGSILDVGLIYLSLVSGGGSDPEVKLRMQARAQMFLMKNDELHTDIIFPKYESPMRTLSMWQNEHFLHEELLKGIDYLSMQILRKYVMH